MEADSALIDTWNTQLQSFAASGGLSSPCLRVRLLGVVKELWLASVNDILPTNDVSDAWNSIEQTSESREARESSSMSLRRFKHRNSQSVLQQIRKSLDSRP